ncbi:MAG: hypothetical protein FJX02_05340 [Alphaproteobacteria bacterium]|nr:hypothetical protein [Alphaproteobacteria bacterium]
MVRTFIVILLGLLPTLALAQAPAVQGSSQFYPAPPPLQAPTVDRGSPLSGLSSPLDGARATVVKTEINSQAEAQMLATASRLVWGRYARLKGNKPGELRISNADELWTIKGRVEMTAPGAEGDWASVEGTIERISANHFQLRGEAAFRVAKVQKGLPCKVAGTLNFRRGGKSQVWRLAEGDNPCDGAQEMLDIHMEKRADTRPVPTQPLPTPVSSPAPSRG